MQILGHGVGGRGDLPLPLSFFAWSAVAMLVISFAALSALWTTPRLVAAAQGRELGAAWQRIGQIGAGLGRLVGAALFVVMLVAPILGPTDGGANVTGFLVFVWLWVGVQFASALFGDVYRALNPLRPLANTLARLAPADAEPPSWAPWMAPITLAAFHWLELAHHDPSSPRNLLVAIVVYSMFVVIPSAWWGRRWHHHADGLARWFGLLARLAPLERREGRLYLRPPGAGLAQLPAVGPTALAVVVVIGGTAFDGVTRTDLWADVVDSRLDGAATVVHTIGLIWVTAVVLALLLAAARWSSQLVAPDADRHPTQIALSYAPSLVPIALGYAVAHYFSLLVFEGQTTAILLSDPFDRGWNLLGTADWFTNYSAVSVTTIAVVQAVAIIVGHLSASVIVHDRALETFETPDQALRSQYAVLAAMIVLTLVALGLVLNA